AAKENVTVWPVFCCQDLPTVCNASLRDAAAKTVTSAASAVRVPRHRSASASEASSPRGCRFKETPAQSLYSDEYHVEPSPDNAHNGTRRGALADADSEDGETHDPNRS